MDELLVILLRDNITPTLSDIRDELARANKLKELELRLVLREIPLSSAEYYIRAIDRAMK